MSEEVTTQEVETVDQASTTINTEQAADTSTVDTVDSVEKLPKWAQKLVADLRQENAKHRTEKTKTEKAAEEAARLAAEEQGKFKELYEQTLAKAQEAETKVRQAELSLLKNKVGAQYKLPQPLVDRLKGETEEEIEADAKAIAAILPKPNLNTDAGNGANSATPKTIPSDVEILEMAATYGLSFEALKQHYETRRN